MNYTEREFQQAVAARKLYHIVGTPTVENFKTLLCMNAIANCPVTVNDVTNAEKIFGPDIASLKGKSTRPKTKIVVNNDIQIPKKMLPDNMKVELCIDIMYVNGMPFLTTIDKTISYRSVIPLQDRSKKHLYNAIDKVTRLYNSARHSISVIHIDEEFKHLMEAVKDDMDVDMNYTNAQDHVPQAKRNNQTLKERIRAQYHQLPYKNIPKVMIRYLVMETARKLNYFPAKGGTSSYFS